MSAEHGGHGQKIDRPVRRLVGGGLEIGAAVWTAAEILATGFLLWPLSIGGALVLIGEGIRRSGRKKQKAHH